MTSQAACTELAQIEDLFREHGLRSDSAISDPIVQLILRGAAPIKPQYIKLCAPSVEAACGSKRAACEIEHDPKRRRLDNAPPKLCNFVVCGASCTLPSCKLNHNKREYLQCKPADLGPLCPMFETYGKCRFGLTCRFGARHIDPALETSLVRQSSNQHVAELNIMSATFLRDLRQRKVPLPRSDQIVSAHRACFSQIGAALENVPWQPEQISIHSKTAAKANVADESFAFTSAINDTCRLVPLWSTENRKSMSWLRGSGATVLAPLTTVGNLPFRRLCVAFGVDVTVSEMAQSNKLLAGEQNEWALLRRHHTERRFGVQLTGCHVDTLASCVELLNDNELDIDFIDLNCGCPIDSEVNFGRGSGILQRPRRLEVCLRAMSQASKRLPITMKMRIGFDDNHLLGTSYIPFIRRSGIAALTVHGRTRQQRYARLADWDYVGQCARAASMPTPADLLDAESCGTPFEPMPVIGNGDIFCFQDYQRRLQTSKCDAVMIGRGALIKPWLFSEIKEQRDWDISGSERMDIVRDFCHFGLEHWGSDSIGVDRTRRFLLEWLSFAHRYVPNALLEVTPCQLTWRPPPFIGRDDRETLLASDRVADWIKISEMFLGKADGDFAFQPKHRSNSYSATSFLNADELQNYKFGCMT